MKNKILIITAIVVISGCVPVKQFNNVKKRNSELETQVQDLSKENIKQTTQNTELKSMVQRLTRMLQDSRRDSTERADELIAVNEQLDGVRKKYEEVLQSYQNNSGDEETQKLLAHLKTLQEQLVRREDALRGAEKNLTFKSDSLREAIISLQDTQKELELRNKRLVELERNLAQKDSAMNELKNIVADALRGFESDQLNVHMKNGKVYVSLEEKLLFSSGSYDVNPDGVSALNKLATVLAKNKEINITVEGHTDDVPFKSGQLLDNWDLSAKRATSVTRILLANKSIAPQRITAAERGEYLPVINTKTPEARKKNRRTEIILTPKLDKILELLDSN